MKQIYSLFALLCFTLVPIWAQTPADSTRWKPDESVAFAQYDTLALEMDLYFPADDYK